MTLPNDWEIRKCLVFCLSFLLAMLGLIGLAALGFDIPGLRQIAGFLFLTFVPGILLLRILRIHNAGIIESLLYSVGLSLIFAIATGVVANFALPPLGVSHPIALAPLTATFTVFFLILGFLAYVRDKNFCQANPPTEANEKPVKTASWSKLNPYMLAILLPLLVILGVSLVNSYHNNILLLAFIFIVAVIIGLVAFNKFIPPRVYPFMIFMIALALVYQTTLISSNLVGSDIHVEYYFSNLVVENGYWDVTIDYIINSCLSIVILAPIYSLLLNMDIVWLFKVIYPLLFCLAPLAIFRFLHLQIKPHYAFLATFFFIAMPMFFMDMAQLCRQQISELFFVLVILLMVDRKLTLIQRTTLVIIFGFGLVASHYGMGTGYIGYLVFGALVLIIIKSRPARTLWQWLIGKSNSLPADLTSPGAFNKKALAIIVGISLVFMLGYYSVVASGVALGGSRVFSNIVQDTGEQLIPSTATSTPVLISPAQDSRLANLTPRLEWNAPTGATSYRLQVSHDKVFTRLLIDAIGITDTHYDIPPDLGWCDKYYWRVKASNESGTSEWSECWRFIKIPIINEMVPAPELPGFLQNITASFPMLNPLTKDSLAQTALGLDFPWASPGGKVWRILQYLVELCLVVGFIRLIFRPRRLGKWKAEYISLIIVSIFILLGVFVLPGRGYGMGAARIFGITLLLVSPLFLFGGEVIAYGIIKLARIFRRGFASSHLSLDSPIPLRCLVLAVLIPYFIFNSGVVFELSRSQTTHFIDTPYSIALSSYRVGVSTTFTKQDTVAADWIVTTGKEDYPVYVEYHTYKLFDCQHGFGWSEGRSCIYMVGAQAMYCSGYIYFGAWNTRSKTFTYSTVYAGRQSISFDDLPWLVEALEKSDKIYDNNSAQVLLYLKNEK